ncbi:uncharacterized protein [Procambarus clarkii]|uniref:uncharacterized protein isoform X1 n=1 Tax=Procambarus clarkii TaxID=6728 RepID=UPI0037430B3F
MLAPSVRSALLLGLLLLAAGSVGSVPARARLPNGQASGDLGDEATKVIDAGVLQRLWSGISTSLGSLTGFGKRDVDARMKRFREDSLHRLKEEMKSLLQVHRRPRRDHAVETLLTRDEKGYYRLLDLDENVNPILQAFAAPATPISMVAFENQDFLFWFITESFTRNNPGRLHVYGFQKGGDLQTTSIDTMGATKCVPVLLLEKFVEFVCVESQRDRAADKTKVGCGVYRLTWAGGLVVTFHRSLGTHGAQDVAIWELGGYTYLAFANSYDEIKQTGDISSVVFRLQVTTLAGKVYTTYDKLDSASFGSMTARGVEAFRIESRQFVAVANYADDLGNVEIESDIFVYDVRRATWKPFQRIRTSAATDWKAFNFISGPNAEYFLVVANEFKYDKAGNKNFEVDSVIYKYDDGKFVPFQCIKTFGAREWVVYQGPNGEFVLAVVNSQAGVFFYQYNGWRFVRSPFKVSTAGVERAWINWAPRTLNNVLLSVVNPYTGTGRPQVFYLKFEHRKPLAVYHNETTAWCGSYKGVLEDGLGALAGRTRGAPKTDRPYTFLRPITIHGDLLLPAGRYFSSVRDIYVKGENYKVDSSFASLSNRVEDVDKALMRVAKARTRITVSKKVVGPDLDDLHFSNVEFKCKTENGMDCTVDDLTVKTINGMDSSFEGAMRLTQDVKLANLSFGEVVLSSGAAASVAFLGGPEFPLTPVSDVVTLGGDFNIVGEKTFEVIKANNLIVSGTVDSVGIDARNLLLTVTDQRINSDVTMASLSTSNIQSITVNGENFSSFVKKLVLNNTNQHITGPLLVDGDLVAKFIGTGNVTVPVDPRVVAARALFHNQKETQEITGAHTLGGLTVQRGLDVWGRINGVAVPRDLYLRNRGETINLPTSFETIVADNVLVKTALGNVKVINGKLDLLLLNGDQTISGTKSFISITLLGHSTVALTVAGYRLQDFQKMLVAEFVEGVNSGRRVLGSVQFLDTLNVTDGIVNGVNIYDILNNAVLVETRSIPRTFIFENAVKVVGDFNVTRQLNGKRPEDYLWRRTSQVFTKNVTFTSDIRVHGNINVKTVNGVKLGGLVTQLVLKDGSQTIVKDVHLYSPVVTDLTVRGQVLLNEVDLADTVVLNSTTVISGVKTFTTVKLLSNVVAGVVKLAPLGTVDGVVFDELFFSNSLRKSGGLQHLVGRNINVLAASTVSGTDLAAFEKSLVHKDGTLALITGTLTFTGPVTVHNLTFATSFDGVSAETYKSSWVMKTGSQSLTGVNVMQSVEASQVTFSGRLIKGANLDRLVRHTAKIDEPTTLQMVSFGRMISVGEVILDGKIQGWNLNKEALRSDGLGQKVTGRKVFRSPVHYTGAFSVSQNIVVKNSPEDAPLAIDVGRLCVRVGKPGTTIYLKQWTIGGDVHFGGTLTLTDSLNGEDVSTLRDVFWLTDVPNVIASVVSFASVNHGAHVNLVLDVMGKINGHDLGVVWDQMLKKECRGQMVNGEFTIDTLTAEAVITDVVYNPPDNIGVTDLLHVFMKDGYQEITGRLKITKLEAKSDIILNGTLNGLRIGTDFVQYGKTAVITGRKTFLQNLIVRGNLTVVEEATIQGVDVSELGRLAIGTLSGATYKIPGVTTFKGLTYNGLDLRVSGTVDGVLVRQDTLLLRTGDQEMTGSLTLNPGPSGVTLEAGSVIILDNRFNKMDLGRLKNLTVKINAPSIVKAPITFVDTCYFNTVTLVNDLINAYNISDLGRVINGDYLVSMGDHLGVALNTAHKTKAALADEDAEIWYYEESSLESVYRFLAVTLQGDYLQPKAYDTLVGLDKNNNLVATYRIASNFPRLYRAVRVLDPVSVAGLGSGLLATCGGSLMNMTSQLNKTLDFNMIPLESGVQSSYGHIHSLAGQIGLEAAFGIVQCKDLVSFRLKDNRRCLAVLDYVASSTVVCGLPSSGFRLLNYLHTTRAVKGAWLSQGHDTYLVVAEEGSDFEPGYLKLFRHDEKTDKMQLVRTLAVAGASDVDAVSWESRAVVTVTTLPNRFCNSSVLVFSVKSEHNLEVKMLQKLEIDGVVHGRLSLTPLGEVGLFMQRRRDLLIYYMKGGKFVFGRKIKTTPSLCPSSFPFVYGNPGTLMISYSGLGWLEAQDDEDALSLVPSTMYNAVYRGKMK